MSDIDSYNVKQPNHIYSFNTHNVCKKRLAIAPHKAHTQKTLVCIFSTLCYSSLLVFQLVSVSKMGVPTDGIQFDCGYLLRLLKLI